MDCCLGGSVIGFDFGSESEGTKNPETKDYRCAVPLIVVEGEEKTQSNKEEKSITIEITYTNGEKEQVHNVKKYSLEDIYMNNGSRSRQFGFEFLPYVNEKETIWVNVNNIKFEMFDNLFDVEDPNERWYMNEISKAIKLVKGCPNVAFSQPFQLIIPNRMYNTRRIGSTLRSLAMSGVKGVESETGIAGKIHLLLWCAELILEGKDLIEVLNTKVSLRSHLVYADKYSKEKYVTYHTLGDLRVDENIEWNDEDSVRATKLLFCKGESRYKWFNGGFLLIYYKCKLFNLEFHFVI